MKKFPLIKTIDDVLPFVKHREEFVVTEHQWGTSIDYQTPLSDTFDTPQARECRGIKFHPDGHILARPYHKFFHIGEPRMRANELLIAGRFEDKHIILDMLHGTMIHPIIIEDAVFFSTRAGITDIAEQALRFATPHRDPVGLEPWYIDFCYDLAKSNLTSIFEWCPQLEPIQEHPANKLILTAIRANQTGEYLTYGKMQTLAGPYYIPMIDKLASNWADISVHKTAIIRWNDGMMGKLNARGR
jgi:RNA ligase